MGTEVVTEVAITVATAEDMVAGMGAATTVAAIPSMAPATAAGTTAVVMEGVTGADTMAVATPHMVVTTLDRACRSASAGTAGNGRRQPAC